MKLDYRTLTEKDLFIAKLKKESIHFGFIPVWRLKEFVRFCKERKLIEYTPTDRSLWSRYYYANYSFVYVATFAQTNFRPLAFITRWLTDLLGYYLSKRQQYLLTPSIHCFRTIQRTINIDHIGQSDWNYRIHTKQYIL